METCNHPNNQRMFWTRDTLRCQCLETWPLQNHLSTLCEYKTMNLNALSFLVIWE